MGSCWSEAEVTNRASSESRSIAPPGGAAGDGGAAGGGGTGGGGEGAGTPPSGKAGITSGWAVAWAPCARYTQTPVVRISAIRRQLPMISLGPWRAAVAQRRQTGRMHLTEWPRGDKALFRDAA